MSAGSGALPVRPTYTAGAWMRLALFAIAVVLVVAAMLFVTTPSETTSGVPEDRVTSETFDPTYGPIQLSNGFYCGQCR